MPSAGHQISDVQFIEKSVIELKASKVDRGMGNMVSFSKSQNHTVLL